MRNYTKTCKTNRKLSAILLFILIAALVVALSGCRKSTVIEQIIYNQNAAEIDWSNPAFVYNDKPKKDIQEENLPSKDIEDHGRKDEPEPTPDTAGDTESDTEVSKPVPDKDSPDDSKKTTEKSEKKDKSKKGDKDKGKSKDEAGESDDPNARQITDGRGKKVTLPEHVNSVVASATAAPIIQMLGGKGILAGTASDFTGSNLVQSAFVGENAAAAKVLWKGSGSGKMSGENFKELLKMKPDVCVNVSGESSFSDTQIKKLKEAKIAYVTLPRFNTHDNIVRAVKIAGEMIGDRSRSEGGINAPALAKDYESFCSALIAKVIDKNGGAFVWDNIDFNNDFGVNGTKNYKGKKSDTGKYTLFISSWDGGAEFTMKHGGSALVKESGVAVAPRGYSNSPLSYYMSAAGTINNGARFVNNKKDYYAAIPLNLNVTDNNIKGSSLTIYPNLNENYARVFGSGVDIGLGQEEFPAIVVENEQVKNAVRASETLWKSHGTATLGNRTENGFVSENGELVISYIRGDYEIYVNPRGIGSWTAGSPESILEAAWTSWRISEKISESDVRDEIKSFYSKFYRADLSGTQLDSIMSGKAG